MYFENIKIHYNFHSSFHYFETYNLIQAFVFPYEVLQFCSNIIYSVSH